MTRAEIVVDLAAIRHNVRLLRELVGGTMITVVKADGYGHGMVEVARAARDAGAEWLAVATLDEARALRAGGDTGPVLTWLTVPGERYDDVVRAGIDLTAYSVAELDEIAAADAGVPARVQLKVDTGLGRGGATRADWERFFACARAGEEAGAWTVTGIWSHLACADEPDHPANDAQQAAFDDALVLADAAGLRPALRHLANSAAAILRPGARYDAVRVGLASYGLDPAPTVDHGTDLRPAMTVRADLALVKHLAAGDSVSYGHTWTADAPTTIGLVPAGYAEGVPVAGSGRLEVAVAGTRRPLRGRVCMDQVLVDLGGEEPPAGTDVVLFGPPGDGRATAQDWAEACGTISYEIVTRVGGRMPRRHVDHDHDHDHDRDRR
ncbi:alanine racemase [Nocardioides sp. 1609]|uniref:alanine racemase n=1 Tax=Nocardioides sp. 1609 TaxID=2508327 RepID=UPI00107007E8|nr:alanine racemase [Nocardioides sp. 1609]